MDHQRHAAAVTDEAVGDEMARDIARALAVDPSPEFLARVRTQIANESPSRIAALKGCATFHRKWRRALAPRRMQTSSPTSAPRSCGARSTRYPKSCGSSSSSPASRNTIFARWRGCSICLKAP